MKKKNGKINRILWYYCNDCEREKIRIYRENNKEKVKQNAKIYNFINRDKIIQKRKQWTENNRGKRREYMRQYKKNKKLTSPEYKIYENARKRIWKFLKYNKKNTTSSLLNCNKKFYKKWIEFIFEKEMNWENYGQYWHIDHVIPLSLADVKDEKEIKKVLCWENTRALKASENLKKKNKLDN